MSGASLAAETGRDQRLYPRWMTRRISLKRLSTVIALTAALSAMPTAAWAHGDIRDSSPSAGTRVTRPPEEVLLILAEPAADGSSVVVTDGCEREVSGPLDIRREILTTPISVGEPGRWLVNLRSISAVDGHVIKEAFTFKVAGRKDCTPEDGDDEPETDISPDTSSRAPIENPDEEGTSFPVIPFALGTVAVIAVALAVRRPWDKS